MSDEIKRDRSPNYPKMPLCEAIKLAETLYKKAGKAKISGQVVAGVFGYAGLNGAALTTIGALNQYGLIDRDRTAGVSVSQLALRLIHPVNEDQDMSARREASLKPRVFTELFDGGFQHGAEDVIANHLRQQEFTNDGARKAASVFKANVDFAKLTTEVAKRESEIDLTPNGKESETGPVPTIPAKQDNQLVQPTIKPQSSMSEFTFPLPSGTASIRVPIPFTDEDYRAFVDAFEVFKRGLTKPEPFQIDTSVTDWESIAEQLAKDGHEFQINGFSYSHDIGFYLRIVKENGLDSRFDPNRGIAYFKPKPTK